MRVDMILDADLPNNPKIYILGNINNNTYRQQAPGGIHKFTKRLSITEWCVGD